MKCPVCGTAWARIDPSPVYPFGGWATNCPCQHIVPGSPLYPKPEAGGWCKQGHAEIQFTGVSCPSCKEKA